METIEFRNENRILYTVRLYGREYKVFIIKEQYLPDSLALRVWAYNKDNENKQFELFGTLTINLMDPRQTEKMAFVKNFSENLNWAERLAEEIGGIDTGKTCQTGYATVHLYDFSVINITEK